MRTGSRRGALSKTPAACSRVAAPAFALKPVANKYRFLEALEVSGEIDVLDVLRDVYPVLEKQKTFIKPKLSERIAPADLLAKLLDDFEAAHPDDEWLVEKKGDRHELTGIAGRGSTHADWIPLEFLPLIASRYPKLHDLLMYSFGLLAKECGILLPYECVKTSKQQGHHGMIYEYLLERLGEGYDEDGDPNIRQALDYYGPDGLPAKYLKLMSAASKRLWFKEFKAFRPADKIERMGMESLTLAAQLMSMKMNLRNFCHNPYGEGIVPQEYMSFVWSYDDQDLMWQMNAEFIDDQAHNIGVVPFSWRTNYGNPENDEQYKQFYALIRKYFEVTRDMAEDYMRAFINEPMYNPVKKKKNESTKRLVDILA